MRFRSAVLTAATIGAALVSLVHDAHASSHREAPFISKNPKVDASDFYLFQSYGTDHTLPTGNVSPYTTIIANYEPLQDPAGGPNFYPLDPDALYEIHIDNNGDAKEDITFQFRFSNPLINTGNGVSLPIGDASVAIPFVNDNPGDPTTGAGGVLSDYTNGVFTATAPVQQYAEQYTLTYVAGDRRTGTATPLVDTGNAGSMTFYKPMDNIGDKSFGTGGYAAYANSFIRNVGTGTSGTPLPGCTTALTPRVFVGQRQEGFAVNLGAIFDLINLSAGVVEGTATGAASIANGVSGNIMNTKNVTSLALEIPTVCLTGGVGADGGAPANPGIIGGWTTASVRQARVINPTGSYASPSVEGGPWAQVSRLGMPLVNEVVIGLKDKDKFNSSQPKDDGQFLPYVTNPTLAKVVDLIFGLSVSPTVAGRPDLVAVFLTGVTDTKTDGTTVVNFNTNGAVGEYQRLNTALPVTLRANQTYLGAAACFADGTVQANGFKELNLAATGCDVAGFPNGRRPGDDVVDVSLDAMEGYLFNSSTLAPARGDFFTDGAQQQATQFQNVFPYLNTPISGRKGNTAQSGY